jgi:hypothetical protein
VRRSPDHDELQELLESITSFADRIAGGLPESHGVAVYADEIKLAARRASALTRARRLPDRSVRG